MRDKDLDGEILRLFAEGRPDQAVALILRDYGPGIRVYLQLRCHDQNDTDDVFSNFLLRLLESPPTETLRKLPEGRLKPWLYSRALKEWRAYRKRPKRPAIDIQLLEDALPAPSSNWRRNDTHVNVAELVADLDDDDRMLVMLRIEGFLWDEIASILLHESGDYEDGLAHRRAIAHLKSRYSRLLPGLKKKALGSGFVSRSRVSTTNLSAHPGAGTGSTNHVYLNTWVAGYFGSTVRIPVGVGARLCVSLMEVYTTEPSAFTQIEVELAHVLILCPGALVAPLRQRLPLPPDPTHVLQFHLQLQRSGPICLETVLLVRNELIHRTHFMIHAMPTASNPSIGTP